MATHTMTRFFHHLRRTMLLKESSGLSDGQLLQCFLARREEAAFEAIVQRHGPMVLGVCRRVLRNVHDAEDAFQATFLVFLRKAASIWPQPLQRNYPHSPCLGQVYTPIILLGTILFREEKSHVQDRYRFDSQVFPRSG
jgi:hypothetical protein